MSAAGLIGARLAWQGPARRGEQQLGRGHRYQNIECSTQPQRQPLAVQGNQTGRAGFEHANDRAGPQPHFLQAVNRGAIAGQFDNAGRLASFHQIQWHKRIAVGGSDHRVGHPSRWDVSELRLSFNIDSLFILARGWFGKRENEFNLFCRCLSELTFPARVSRVSRSGVACHAWRKSADCLDTAEVAADTLDVGKKKDTTSVADAPYGCQNELLLTKPHR